VLHTGRAEPALLTIIVDGIVSTFSVSIVSKGEELVYDEAGRRYCFEVFLGGSLSSCSRAATGPAHSRSSSTS